MASLDVQKEYACAHPFSRALYMNVLIGPQTADEKSKADYES
jgi:hypothetical protein